MRFAAWLDQVLGPPLSGLAMLALVGALSGFSAYVAHKTLGYIFRDRP
jgi:hypothetical protein